VDGSLNKISPLALDIAVSAVSAWQGAAPELPTLVVERGSGAKIGYDPAEENENSIVFAPEGAAQAEGALAITIVTYDKSLGQILDADIIFNGEHRFAPAETLTSDSRNVYDLQNVLTHELGHFLGLGEENTERRATMFSRSAPAEIRKRDLSKLDRVNIRELYKDNAPLPPECGVVSRSPSPRFRPGVGVGVGCCVALLLGRRFGSEHRLKPAFRVPMCVRIGLLLGLCGFVPPSNEAIGATSCANSRVHSSLHGDLVQVVFALYPSR
jgi:hypothetical protein